MIKFKAYLALITFGFCQIAWAGLPPTTLKDLNGSSGGTTFNYKTYTNQITSLGGTNNLIENSSHNLLLDPSFEGTAVTNKWTAVTVTPTLDTANTYYDGGKQSAKISPSAQTFSLAQFATNIPNGQYGGANLEASCKIKTTVSGVQLCPTNGGTTLTSMCVNVPTDGNWDYVVQDFPGVNASAPGVIIQATSAVTGTINVDDCYVGVARNLGTVAQATQVGTITWAPTASCSWSTTSTSLANFTANASCPTPTLTGSLTAPGTKIPAFVMNVANGYSYIITATGAFRQTGTNTASFAFGDGTVTTNVNAVMLANQSIGSVSGTYTPTTSGSVTINLMGLAEASTTATVYADTASRGLQISVQSFPTSQLSALTANTSPANWSGTSTLNGTTASTSFADLGGITGTVSSLNSQNISCSTASGQVGITCTLPSTGLYHVCHQGAFLNTTAGGYTYVELTDGSNNIVVPTQQMVASTANGPTSFGACGNYSASSTSVTFKERGYVSSNTGSYYPTGFSIVSINTPIAAPILNNSITTNANGAWRVESASMSSACAVSKGTGFATIAAGAGSQCVLTFVSAFSDTPVCGCNVGNGNSSSTNDSCYIVAVSTTSATAQVFNASGTNDSQPRQVWCQGPR